MTTPAPAPQPGDLIAWHIPAPPHAGFRRPVASIAEGRALIDALGDYDAYLLDRGLQDDFPTVGGVSRWESDGDGGFDWYDVDDEETD